MAKNVRVPLTEDQKAKIKEAPGRAGSERVGENAEAPSQTTSMVSQETLSADLDAQDALSGQDGLSASLDAQDALSGQDALSADLDAQDALSNSVDDI